MFDIDHFKQYNDSNGHEEGDKLLMELSQLVQEYTRKTSVVARRRWRNSSFSCRDSGHGSIRVCERLREVIASHSFPHREGQPFGFLSISGGIATFPDHERSIQSVIRLADEALYKAKNSGRNRIVVHNSSLNSARETGAPSFLKDSQIGPLSDPDCPVIQ